VDPTLPPPAMLRSSNRSSTMGRKAQERQIVRKVDESDEQLEKRRKRERERALRMKGEDRASVTATSLPHPTSPAMIRSSNARALRMKVMAKGRERVRQIKGQNSPPKGTDDAAAAPVVLLLARTDVSPTGGAIIANAARDAMMTAGANGYAPAVGGTSALEKVRDHSHLWSSVDPTLLSPLS